MFMFCSPADTITFREINIICHRPTRANEETAVFLELMKKVLQTELTHTIAQIQSWNQNRPGIHQLASGHTDSVRGGALFLLVQELIKVHVEYLRQYIVLRSECAQLAETGVQNNVLEVVKNHFRKQDVQIEAFAISFRLAFRQLVLQTTVETFQCHIAWFEKNCADLQTRANFLGVMMDTWPRDYTKPDVVKQKIGTHGQVSDSHLGTNTRTGISSENLFIGDVSFAYVQPAGANDDVNGHPVLAGHHILCSCKEHWEELTAAVAEAQVEQCPDCSPISQIDGAEKAEQ